MTWFKKKPRRTALAWCLACAMWLWSDDDMETCRRRGHNLM